jgi:putative ABC transport system permease protein
VAANHTALPRLDTVHVDGTILFFALAASMLTGLVFGLVPAVQTFQEAVAEHLGDATRGSSEGGRGHWLRAAFVVAETGLALMLLVGAGLLVRSFVRVFGLDPGLDASQVMTVRLALPEARYPESDRIHGFYDRLLTDLRALPGVRSAGGASSLLLSRLPNSSMLRVQGIAPPPTGTPEEPVTTDSVTTGFFETLRVPLKSGRLFEARDAHPAHELRARPVPTVAVINEALARRFFPGQDPLGRRITFGNPATRRRPGRRSSASWATYAARTSTRSRGPRRISTRDRSRTTASTSPCARMATASPWRAPRKERSGPSTPTNPSPACGHWRTCCAGQWPSVGSAWGF